MIPKKTLKKLLMAGTAAALLAWAPALASEIHDAARTGDLTKVKALIEKDAGLVKAKDVNGRTPLHWASRGVHLEVVRFLLEKGADANALDNNSVRPLLSVVTRGHLQAAELLLDHGADLEARDGEGTTVLHAAAYRGLKDLAALLIGRGADVNALNKYGRTPLFEAIGGAGVPQLREKKDLREWSEIVKAVVAGGAKLDVRDSFGETALTSAVQTGEWGLIKILLDHGAAVPTSGQDARLLLHRAARIGLKELTELMLDRGADDGTINANGGTLLHDAAAGGLTDIARRIIAKGGDVNRRDRYGSAPIHMAAAGRRLEMIRLLAENKADLNLRTPEGITALHIAGEAGFEEGVEFLVSQGADAGPAVFPVLTGEYLGQKKPGSTPELFAPGIVSKEGTVHGAPVFSPNGDEITWFSFPGPITKTMRRIDGRWSAPVKADNVGANPTLSPDGQRLYSQMQRPAQKNGPALRGIWISDRAGDGWGEPKWFDSQVNSIRSGWEIWPTRGGTIYFSSAQAGGKGGSDVYRAPFQNGIYAKAENLGQAVNSAADEWAETGGFVDADEQVLIFGSNRPGGYGGSDLYVSFRNDDGSWTKAVNLGRRINTEGEQMWPYVSPDGRYLFYVNLEKGGNGEVLWVEAEFLRTLKRATSDR